MTGVDGQDGTTTVSGSQLNADDSLNIYTGELDVLASVSTQRTSSNTQSGTVTIAQTVWGAAGGPTVNASLNASKRAAQSHHAYQQRTDGR